MNFLKSAVVGSDRAEADLFRYVGNFLIGVPKQVTGFPDPELVHVVAEAKLKLSVEKP